jgi:16S rRNA processing protein RimM
MEHFVVGIIRGTHGLAGNCKVESTSGEFQHFTGMKDVVLRKNGIETKRTIEKVSIGGGILYIKFSGINSPEEAKKLSGSEIVVSREFACPCGKDEYYVEDLKQCQLVYTSGSAKGMAEKSAATTAEPVVVGTITDVLEGGAGDLFEVVLSESCSLLSQELRTTSSGKPRKVLVPFKKEFIGTVDTKNKQVQLMHLWILE